MSVLDNNIYEKGIKVTKEEMEEINLIGDSFHPEWSYKIVPNYRK